MTQVVESVCLECGDEWSMYKGHPFKCPLCGGDVVEKEPE